MGEPAGEIADIRLSHIQLINFRCFKQFFLNIDAPYILFEGDNGIGKTSILEALYYACYLRSFRTHTPRDLIHFGANEFFVKIGLTSLMPDVSHTIQVGFSENKRIVKIDQKAISSYKDLMAHYRVVSVTESDLELIQGGPQHRRLFLDQMLMLLDPTYAQILKTYRQLVDQRNALLQHRVQNKETYEILTFQLWQQACKIQLQREEVLTLLGGQLNVYGAAFIEKFNPIEFVYRPKCSLESTYELFRAKHIKLVEQENQFRRTLFGSHLDDMLIIFQNQSSRFFASRGQQKLIVILLKIAQLELLLKRNIPGICLLDDFMTDFDVQRAKALLEALKGLGAQLIFTAPFQGEVTNHLLAMGAQTARLTN